MARRTGRGTGRARGVSKVVVLRRNALPRVTRIIADGLHEWGRVVVEQASADAPDSPLDPYPIGEGLPKQGGVLTYVGKDKVDGWSIRGPQPNKPAAARPLLGPDSATVIAGFGFPARFAETGTIDTPSQPFLRPAFDRLAPAAPKIIGTITRAKIGGNQ